MESVNEIFVKYKSNLSSRAYKLLTAVANDYYGGIPVPDRKFESGDEAGIIHNLLRSPKYEESFSVALYKEIFLFLTTQKFG